MHSPKPMRQLRQAHARTTIPWLIRASLSLMFSACIPAPPIPSPRSSTSFGDPKAEESSNSADSAPEDRVPVATPIKPPIPNKGSGSVPRTDPFPDKTSVPSTAQVMPAACSEPAKGSKTDLNGSGNLLSQALSIPEYRGIAACDSGRVIVTSNGQISAKITADDNVLPLLNATVSGDLLSLGIPSNLNLIGATPTLALETDSLQYIYAAGTANIDVDKLAGTILIVRISGDASVTVSGEANSIEVQAEGRAAFRGAALRVKFAQVAASGSATVEVNASDQAMTSTSGSATVKNAGPAPLAN